MTAVITINGLHVLILLAVIWLPFLGYEWRRHKRERRPGVYEHDGMGRYERRRDCDRRAA